MSFAIPTSPASISSAIPAPTDVTVRETIEAAVQRSSTDVGPPREIKAAELAEQVSKINKTLEAFALEFDITEADNRVVTRIIDKVTGDVIRQIPSETVLRVSERLETAVGLLIEERA